MFVLITGGSKNGKSSLAEKIIENSDKKKYYIATMEPFGEEAAETIKRHKALRAGKNFITIEKYTDLDKIVFTEKGAVLVECLCNLCANEMFSLNVENACEKIIREIKYLSDNSEILVAVTSQISCDGIIYSKETTEYTKQISLINRELTALSDITIESVFGIPVLLKGEMPSCLC